MADARLKTVRLEDQGVFVRLPDMRPGSGSA
jgi:hypothetical protein